MIDAVQQKKPCEPPYPSASCDYYYHHRSHKSAQLCSWREVHEARFVAPDIIVSLQVIVCISSPRPSLCLALSAPPDVPSTASHYHHPECLSRSLPDRARQAPNTSATMYCGCNTCCGKTTWCITVLLLLASAAGLAAGLYVTVPCARTLTTCYKSPEAGTGANQCWSQFWTCTKAGKAGE